MDKIKSIYVCENAFLSEGSKNLNLIGIFENINLSSFPGKFPLFFLAVYIYFEENKEHQIEIKLISEDKKESIAKYTVNGNKVQIIHKFINYEFTKTGNYEFQIFSNNKNIGSTIINLR